MLNLLEKALVAAREAIRVLQGGGNQGSMIQVSNPSNFSNNIRTSRTNPRSPSSYSSRRRDSLPEYAPVRPRNILQSSSSPVSVRNEEGGNANLQIQAKVQFLDNKVRPAGFTEFFLVDRKLSEILLLRELSLLLRMVYKLMLSIGLDQYKEDINFLELQLR